MKKTSLSFSIVFFAVILSFVFFSQSAFAQISGSDRDNGYGMLEILKDSIKKNYYDPKYKGVDLDFVFSQAKELMKNANTRDELMVILAQTTLAFDDSHTFFVPPSRSANVDYGWRLSMFGNDCFVSGIKPKSDAEAKGLKVGDKVLAIDGFKPTRENLWQMYYRYYSIKPSSRVRFMVQSPNDAKSHIIDVDTKIVRTSNAISYEDIFNRIIKKGWDQEEDRYIEVGKELLIWKMSTFSTSEKHIDDMMKKASNFNSLIIDLRNNGGGYVDAMKRLIGYFSDKDIKIGDEKSKKETKPVTAKTRGNNIYKGKLTILVGNDSASASEIFARIIQLEKRGKVMGDKTAGAVMESRYYPMETGVGSVLYFGASVTIADLIMTDGNSLEKVGVKPDEIALPSGEDLATSKDTVLSKAAKEFGVDISPEKAGTFFPIKWNN